MKLLLGIFRGIFPYLANQDAAILA